MNAILLLLGLLALSYLGSALRGQRSIRGIGLPSGAEYVCLGVLLGAHGLGVIPRSLLESFEPVALVCASWIAFVAGLGYGRVGTRSVALGRALSGLSGTGLVAGTVFAAVYAALPWLVPELLADRVLVAGGAACVCSGSTRQAVRWVVERYLAKGPLADTLADHARASALVPVLILASLLAYQTAPGLAFLLLPARIGLTFGIGALLGLVALMLLSRELTRDEIWGVLVGTSLLAMGVAARLGLSSLAAGFALGLTLGLLSRRRSQLSAMVRPTERAVLLPLAVLAGGLVDVAAAPALVRLLAIALGARAAAELLRGLWLMGVSRAARRAGPLVGYTLVSTGDVTLACAVSMTIAIERPVVQSLLAIAALGLLLGELCAPLALRRALERAGELDQLPAGEPLDSLVPPAPSPEPGGHA